MCAREVRLTLAIAVYYIDGVCVCVCVYGFTSAISSLVNPETHCQVDSVAKADIASLCRVEESRL